MDNIDLIQLKIDEYYSTLSLIKRGRIVKLPNGKYRVLSKKNKNLGTSDSKSGAEKRLRQVEYFKHQDKNNDEEQEIIDLTSADDFSYSAITRCLKQQSSMEQLLVFLKLFKNCFDKAVKNKLYKPEKIALQNSLIKFNKIYPIKLKKKLTKQAATTELGDPTLVGKYLADIIRFTLNRISPEKRPHALTNLRQKIYNLNEAEISMKNLPATASIGQSITFVKHVLFNHNPQYVRAVINNIVRNLT